MLQQNVYGYENVGTIVGSSSLPPITAPKTQKSSRPSPFSLNSPLDIGRYTLHAYNGINGNNNLIFFSYFRIAESSHERCRKRRFV